MNPVHVARLLGRVLILVTLVASGIYFVLYLYRWEWNRAQVSGLIFIATELALVGTLVLRRLHSIDQRLGPRSPSGPPAGGAGGTGGAAPLQSETPTLRWLDPNRTAVFIPVLLGAGAVLAALAYVVERMAAYVAGGVDARPVRLHGIAFPEPGPHSAAPIPLEANRPARPLRTAGRVTAVLVGLGALALALSVLADYTQSRPEPSDLAGTTEVTVRLGYRVGDPVPVEDTAIALFESCRLRLPHASQLVADPEVIRPQTVVLRIEPALGGLGERRLRGCLSDYTLDGTLAYVEDVRRVP